MEVQTQEGTWRLKTEENTNRYVIEIPDRESNSTGLASETLHGLARRRDISRNLIRLWIAKHDAGALDDDAIAADAIDACEARIAALERPVGKQALEIEFSKGALKHSPGPESAATSVVAGPGGSASQECRLMGIARSTYYDQSARNVDDTALVEPIGEIADRGSQYAAGLYQQAPADHGLVGSIAPARQSP